jgi:hypothetical protein
MNIGDKFSIGFDQREVGEIVKFTKDADGTDMVCVMFNSGSYKRYVEDELLDDIKSGYVEIQEEVY